MSSNYQAVLAAVREWIRTQDQQFGIWEPRNQLEKQITGSTYANGNLSDAYNAQVLRAVNLLISEGALVKYGEGRDAVYLTPEADRASRERAAIAQEQRAAELLAWHQRKLRLADHGLQDMSSSETGIRLSPESWDSLLDSLDELAARRERPAP